MDYRKKINEKKISGSRTGWLVVKENLTNQKNILTNRYYFLYQNSPLILAYILSQRISSSLATTITKRSGITIENSDKWPKDKKNDINIFELLEDYLLSGGTYADFLLSSLCSDLSKQERFFKVKSDYDLEKGNVGIGKYDECMKTVLDIVYSFISSQKEAKTSVYIISFNGLYDKEEKITKSDINHKLEALDRYYDILAYRNTKENDFKFKDSDKGIGIKFKSVGRSLVNHNLFVGAFCSQVFARYWWENRCYLEEDKKRTLYFKIHDELPWDFHVKCLKNGNGCRSDISLREEDIFYHKEDFSCICPCCGKLNSVDFPYIGNREKIKDRIRKRFINDDKLTRKLSLMSELVSLDGLDLVKQKLKK